MFSKTIIDSDLFMDLPLTAQALYFHLAMRADDDGFIGNSKKLCRMLGVGEDDLALLIEKELLIKFDSGVVAVKHWKVNNLIKNDRYKPTIYQEEKSFLEVENNTYRKCEKKPRRAPQKDEKASLEPKWNPSGTHLEPQVRLGKDSIGKDSIGKDSLDKEIECADGTDEPCGSLVSPEGDIAADAASSASAEQSNKVDFSFSSAAPKADKGDTCINDEARESDTTPKADKHDISAAAPRAYNPDTFFEMPKAGDDAPRFDNLVPEEYTKDPQWENHLAEAKARLRRMFGAPKPPKKTDTKPRYGSFDPEEAMAIAIARTEYEFAQMDKNKSSWIGLMS
jgi:hypothetical protein